MLAMWMDETDGMLHAARKLTHAAAAVVPPLQEKGVQLLLPTDVVVADKFDPNANTQTVSAEKIPDGWMVRPRCCRYCA
jgi:3-phosphoglycerate kinase